MSKILSLDNGKITLESMSQALWYNRWTFGLFKKFVGGSILEVGCGIGNFTTMLSQCGRLYAIDIKRSYLKRTKEKLRQKAAVGFGDIEKGSYFFRPRQFDCVVCLNVLEHIKDDQRALENIYRLLKPGKHLILLVPAHPFLFGHIDKAIDHYRRYKKDELIASLKCNAYKIILAREINFLGALGWWLSGKIFKDSLVSKKKLQMFDRFAKYFLPFENLFAPPFGTSIIIIAKKLA